MGLEAKLVQKLSQSLLMTPQLQQAIKLLQLGRLEYQEAIERELLENPILEEVRDSDETAPRAAAAAEAAESARENLSQATVETADVPAGDIPGESKSDWEGYLESFTDYSGTAVPRGTFDFEERPSLEATLTRGESIHEHLASQIRLIDVPFELREILPSVIGNINRDGYLEVAPDEIAESSTWATDDVRAAVDLVRSLEPPGVGACSVAECLHLQLDRLGRGEALEGRIVSSHLDKLEKRRYDQIAKLERTTVEAVYEAVKVIKSLEPRPGRPFSDEAPRYITPDIYVQKVGGEYVIHLNEDGLPRLRVSPYYLKLLRDQESGGKAYLTDRLKAAQWLIKSINQRQQTIYRVTESIVRFQKDFLDFGLGRLRPLVLKEVADDIGMHESTVSRVTTNKYVHTPQGVFELKYFFTTGIKAGDGEVLSSSAVKERIRNLVAAEDPADPISDQGLVERLAEERVEIARRTVAKYREALGIGSSAKRKKLF